MTRWRLPAAIVLLVVLGGALIAWLRAAPAPAGYLSPASTAPDGGHALATILAGRGTTVLAAAGPPTALAAAASGPRATILITSPGLLTAAQLRALGREPADLVLTAPTSAALAALAPGVLINGRVRVVPRVAGCTLPAAVAAGSADAGGIALRGTAPRAPGTDAWRSCYDGTLVTDGAVTLLGTGTPLTNQYLARLGDAALALNLLGHHPRLIWLTPAGSGTAAPAAPVTFTSLLPPPVYMIATQLAIAVALLAWWRSRRLGPLVPERLPAVVRAAETAEGHGRLYHARRARGQAALALRSATASRLRTALGLTRDAGPAAIAAEMAARTGRPPDQVSTVLDGPPPADEAALVRLAADLDELDPTTIRTTGRTPGT